MKIRHNHKNAIKAAASNDVIYVIMKNGDPIAKGTYDAMTKKSYDYPYPVQIKKFPKAKLNSLMKMAKEAHRPDPLKFAVNRFINDYSQEYTELNASTKAVNASWGGWGKFYGLNDVEFTVPNDTDDPTIFYNGKYYNYYDIEDTLWDYYKDECNENGVKPDENDFKNWVANNSYYVYDLLDEISPKSEPGRGVYREEANTLRRSIKSSTITAAADVTNLKILIEGTGWVEVYEDSYEQGEGAYANSWDFDIAGTYDTMQEVVDAIANATGASNDIQNYVYIDGRIDTDMEQNADGYEPSDVEYEAWKRGEETLYLAHIGVSLKVTSDTHEMTEEEAEGFGLSIY